MWRELVAASARVGMGVAACGGCIDAGMACATGRGLGARLLTDLPTLQTKRSPHIARTAKLLLTDTHHLARSRSHTHTAHTLAYYSLIATSCAFTPLRTSSLSASRKVPIVTRNAFSTSSIIDAVAKCI